MAIIPPLSRKTRILLMVSLMGALVIIGITLGIVIPLVHSKNATSSSQDDVPQPSILGNFSIAAIATDAAPCAKVGKDILLKNGSAVDCAIATLLCMGVVLPQSMGLGGGFFMTIYDKASGTVRILDSRETAPANATRDMFGSDPQASSLGGKAVAIPGELHGFLEAHSTYGKLSWSELFEGAINVSRYGFPVALHLAQAIQQQVARLDAFPSLKYQLTNPETNELYKVNEIMKDPVLAETLEKLAKDPTAFDREIAPILVEDVMNDGGILTLDDIVNYTPVWRNATEALLKGSKYTLYSVPLPGSGPILTFILNILQNYNFTSDSLSPSNSVLTYHRIIEAFKFAYARRMELGDFGDEEVQEVVNQLMSVDYANSIKEKIFDNRTFDDPKYYGVRMFQDDDHGTAHLAIVAPNGDAVSVTSTTNAYFGSKLRSNRTGIILNNEMDDFAFPNITNGFNVPPSEPNYVVPGKRPLSSMCPSIIIDNESGNVKMALGGAGGTHITTGTVLVILRNLFMGDNIKQAIDAPRIHHQLFPNYTTYEKDFPTYILDGLEKLGHTTNELKGRGAVMQGVSRGDDNRLYANSDYRKGGTVDGF